MSDVVEVALVHVARPVPHEQRTYGRHDGQDDPEGANDRGAGRQIQRHRQINAERRHDRAHGPADRQAGTDVVRVQHRSDGGDDQITEDQQHARDRDRRRHHESKRGVEQKIPEANGHAGRLGALRVDRDGEELLPEDEVEETDAAVEHRRLPDVVPRDRQDVPHQHVVQMLGLRRGLAHRENRRRRGHGVADADDGFLRNPRPLAANRREDGRADEREREADPVHDRRMRVAAGERHQHRDGRAERGNLRQRQVHEDDAALDDVHAQIGMNAGENQARDERRGEKFENGCQVHSYLAPVRLMAATTELTS